MLSVAATKVGSFVAATKKRPFELVGGADRSFGVDFSAGGGSAGAYLEDDFAAKTAAEPSARKKAYDKARCEAIKAQNAARAKAYRDRKKKLVGALASATIDLDLDSGDELLPIDPAIADDLAAKLQKNEEQRARHNNIERARRERIKADVAVAKSGSIEDPAKAAEILQKDAERKARDAARMRAGRAKNKALEAPLTNS